MISSPSMTGMVPATSSAFMRAMRCNGFQCAESLATSGDKDTTISDIRVVATYFGRCALSARWIARSGFVGTELPLLIN
jgi:hypothetical protein